MVPFPGVVRRLAPALAAVAAVAAPLLPATAQGQEPVGSTVVGELVQAWPEAAHDDAAGQAAVGQPLTWVQTAEGESVRIPTEDAADLPVGATVELTVGAEVGDPAAGEGLDPAREVLDSQVVAEAEPARAVTNEVTVAAVAPRGVAHDAVTAAQVAAAVDGPVAQFWSEQTHGAVNLHVAEVHDRWVDTTVGCGKPGVLWDQVAATVGFTPGPGKHLLLYLSTAAPANCAYGLAEVGSEVSSGGRAYVREVLPSLIAHELGHNFGLGHSSALYCADGAESGGCSIAAYRDHYDVMGVSWQQLGALNAVQAATLGVLGSADQRTLQADGSSADVTLAPVSGTSGVRAVRLAGHGGRQYWIELRTATGQDSWLGTGGDRYGLQTGVLVRRTGNWPNTSLLLDATPAAGRDGDFQAAVPVGRTVRLTGGFAVTVTGQDAAGATLSITSTVAAHEPAVDPAPAGDGTPDVLEAAGTAPSADAAPPVEATRPAPPAAEQSRPSVAPTPEPDAVDEAEVAAQPVVVPAAQSRSLAVPAVAAAALAGAALFVAVRLVRTRVRR